MGRSKHSGGHWPDSSNTGVGGENVRNSKGKLSEQSKERREKRYMNDTAEGLVKGLRENKGHLPPQAGKMMKKVKKFVSGD